MPVPNDPGRCRTALDPESTLIAVVEMSQSSWLVAAIVPGLERHPLKKLAVDEAGLLRQLERWRDDCLIRLIEALAPMRHERRAESPDPVTA